MSGGDSSGSAWEWLEACTADAEGGQLFALLQRYSLPCAGRQLLASLRSQASDAALELLSMALCGNATLPPSQEHLVVHSK